LIDKAEHPEIMIKQVILDMENQLLQVKTQVAIAMADQHLLEKKQKDNEDKIAEWNRKAEMAVGKKQDDLARAAIERGLHYKQMTENFRQQVADQTSQVETLKNALNKLTQKLEEARSRSELLISQHRRARTLDRAADAQSAVSGPDHGATFDRMRHKVMRKEAIGQAKTELLSSDAASVEDRFAQMEKEDEINRILGELKAKRA
jgi:phage shock protein A